MATKDTVFLQYQNDIDEYYHGVDSISQLKNDINEAEHEVHELETLEVKLTQKVASANSCVANAKRVLQTEEKKLSAAQSSKDNNLLDDTVYSQELARIGKEKNDRIASEKAKIENDANQKRTSISDRIKKLKDAKKNDKFVIPSSLADKVSSAKSKRAAWDEFFDNASEKGKKIKDRIVGISDPEIQSLAATFHSTNQLINKCNSVKEIENGGEPDYSKNSLNSFVIPFVFAAVTVGLLIFLFLKFDYSWSESVGETIATVINYGLLMVLLGFLASMLADEDVGARIGMVVLIPISMLIILIYNNWGQGVGFFSWLGNIFWLIVLGAALFGLSLVLSEGGQIPMLIIGAILSFFWLRKIEIRTPGFLTSIFSFVSGGIGRFGIPILAGIVVFLFVAFLFTKTKLGMIATMSEKRQAIAFYLAEAEKSLQDFKFLYNYKEIGKYVQNREDIDNCNLELKLLDSNTKSAIEKSEKEIVADYQNKKTNLDQERQRQKNEKDSKLNTLVKNVAQFTKDKKQAELSLIDANNELTSNHNRLDAKKSLLQEDKDKLAKSEKAIVDLKDKINKTAKALNKLCNDPLENTAGKLCDSVFLNLPIENKEGFQEFAQIQHNSEKLVLIYNENEIENNNLSKSLSNYIDWFVEAFVKVNNWEVIDNIRFKIIDVVSGARNYIGGNNGKIFEAFGDNRAITQYEKKIKDHINRITESSDLYELKDVNIVELNKKILEAAKSEGEKFGTEEPNEQYIITFVLIPNIDVQNVEIIPASLWASFNDCKRYGIMPIFLVGGNTWDGIDDNSQLKVQVKKKNVYYISGGKFKKMKISSTEC